ncbi:hypothetical protein F4V43_02425 [Paenibacillus spiritus]|uniref:Uncharacterized protein n=1 Tax=Paenibacillus spiritus TaxID=2496557 RepID=A0A5J5GI33_9BACL|nr:hypothetical protein [Paenibacillus spiritus]KAA9007362.1 hypothetical protein F4V43_02425 [Paenibacillus spiritus]
MSTLNVSNTSSLISSLPLPTKDTNILDFFAFCRTFYDENISSPLNNYQSYEYIGFRFEDKDRQPGEICDCSRHNIERVDERDFPAYGSEEYNNSALMAGTSVWDLKCENNYHIPSYLDFMSHKTVYDYFPCKHLYIVAGYQADNTFIDSLDEGEIVIVNAEVLIKVY